MPLDGAAKRYGHTRIEPIKKPTIDKNKNILKIKQYLHL